MSENKDFLMTLKAGGVGLPGHSKRIFSLKFDYGNENVLYSGGWDDAIYVNDLREGGAVGVVLGPHISGDAIDVKGNLLILKILMGNVNKRASLDYWKLSK